LRCLSDLINAQTSYYSNSLKILQDLQKQLSVYGLNSEAHPILNENSITSQPSLNVSSQVNGSAQLNRQQQANTFYKQNSNELLSGNLNLNMINKPIRKEIVQQHQQQKAVKAKILFDFEAGDENELTVHANEVRI
jgi:hypothetical protein